MTNALQRLHGDQLQDFELPPNIAFPRYYPDAQQ